MLEGCLLLSSVLGCVDVFMEKEMATHSSILAWRSPWTEKPGRLQSMRSQRVEHDLAAKQYQRYRPPG